MVSSLKSQKDSLFVSLNFGENTFCVVSLLSTNGQIIGSSWIQASNYYSSNGVGRFKLSLVTKNLIFGIDLNEQNSINQYLFIWSFNTKTQKYVKI